MPPFILPLALAVLMFVVGLRLTMAGLASQFRHPRALLTGLAVQVVGLPVLALVLSGVLGLAPDVAIGLLVIAVAPGGITSNYVAMAARADLALSTAMTLVTSLAAAVTIPAVLWMSGAAFAGTNLSGLLRTSLLMFAVSAVPMLLGMGLRRLRPDFAARFGRPLDRLSAAVFALIVLATFWENREAMLMHAASIGPAAVLLNGLAIATGFVVGHLARLEPSQRLAIAIEVGLQNVALAMVVATTLLGRSELTAPALVYAVVMNVAALGLIALGRRLRTAGACA